jgi:hypothetical protein
MTNVCGGSGQLLAGLLPPTDLHIQDAKVTVTVGLEWAHLQLLGYGEGLAVGGFG